MRTPVFSKVIAWSACWLVLSGVALGGAPKPATPEQIRELIAKAGDAKDHNNASLVIVLDEADVYVRPSGLATTESCLVKKVLSAAGVRSQSVQRFNYDPATNRITVRSIRVHRKDGAVEDLPLAELVSQPTPQGSIFWGGKQDLLSIPNLQIGDTIEVRTSKTGYNVAYLNDSGGGTAAGSFDDLIPPMPGHWYEVVTFPGSHPILHKRYSVHMPKDMPLQYEVYNGAVRSSLWFDGDRHVYTFSTEDVPAIKREPHMVSTQDCTTKVVLATVKDWPEKSRWFHDANINQFEADDHVRKLVADLTRGLTDEDAKIAACLHWVADNVRYCGTTRGPQEGYTLHKGIETVRDRAGVCKDKAGMLVTMLRVLGHDSYAAMTMAGSRIEAIPADQFNHCVTVIREKDGSFRILDPTWVPYSREWWSSREALQGIVYGTPEGEPLTLTPYYEPEYNLYAGRSRGLISEDGTLRMDINMDLKGYPCTYFRRTMNKSPALQRATLEEHVNIAPNARIEEVTFNDPQDYAQDSRVHMLAVADGYVVGDGSRRLFRLPLLRHPLKNLLIPDLFYDVTPEKRQYGMRLRATRLLRYQETLQLPPGWEIESLPEAVTFDAPAASIHFEAVAKNKELHYQFEFRLKQHTVAAEDYAGLKEAYDTMRKTADQWVVCVTESEPRRQHAAR